MTNLIKYLNNEISLCDYLDHLLYGEKMEINKQDGIINTKGGLLIRRAGQMRLQNCPFTESNPDNSPICCGDWCPHFGEVYTGMAKNNKGFNIDGRVLEICNGKTLVFDEFTDNRKP